VRVRDIVARLGAQRGNEPSSTTPEAFTVMHSADLDVHLAGVAHRPTTRPPWPTSTWDRHGIARLRAPSDLARVLLDLHPAFIDSFGEERHWMQVDQAETMAMEWVAVAFTAAEATDWLAVEPDIVPLRARDLANAGLTPHDLRRGIHPGWARQEDAG
jgi:hypothetical protein